MTIEALQQEVIDAGWQFQEHVFNDGGPDCYLRISPSKFCHMFGAYRVGDAMLDERRKEMGWGRFDRRRCWESAVEMMRRIISGEVVPSWEVDFAKGRADVNRGSKP